MFDLAGFIGACRSALEQPNPPSPVTQSAALLRGRVVRAVVWILPVPIGSSRN